jgi:hypothetical protein
MKRTLTGIAAGTFLALLLGATIFAEGDKEIVITHASADLTTHRITITGVNFLGKDGKKQPTVLFQQAVLPMLGTLYGGDGISTFALPDLRGVAPNGLTYTICVQGIFPSRN